MTFRACFLCTAATAIVLLVNSPADASEPRLPEASGVFDLTRSVVIVPPQLTSPERKAVAMLVEEVAARSQVRWRITETWPKESGPVIAVGPAAALGEFAGRFAATLSAETHANRPDGFRIRTEPGAQAVFVIGDDERGVLFGVGRLLRELRIGRGHIQLASSFSCTTAPRVSLRGHQLGYRPKTNSYDGWDLPQWEQYIRDLAVFGTNAIELIPPRSDDDADSPHFPRPPMEMMVGMSQLCADYGLDVWIWYPAMDADYSDPATVEHALREWGDVFRRLPRIDAVFVPGGDPGHTRPRVLFDLLERQTKVLHRHHPRAQMWVSPQSFNQAWLDEFLQLLADQPAWLTGVVFGPQVRISLAELRAAVPKRYPIRRYPDITHSLMCQYPVPDWDLAFALTQGREVINPRPAGMAGIFRAGRDQAVGFITYSEGCNDDVNKILWSGLGWDPDGDVGEILRQYSRYFLGERYTDSFAQALLALERNWQGPLLANRAVETTLAQFQDMERAASPRDLASWRFQQGLYRAYYDAFLRDRLLAETDLEAQALAVLRRARELGALVALDRAQAILDRALTERSSPGRHARVHELAEALFQSIRMQLSVERYKAISVGRGANLDTLDVPLNNRLWLLDRFAEIRKQATESSRIQAIDAVLHRTDPGPGGFYDDLGDLSNQPHLVRGAGFDRDPAFLRSALVGFGRRPGWPLAWCQNAQSLNDAPLSLHYSGLDRGSRYRIRVVYTGDVFSTTIRLDADGSEVHPLIPKPFPVRPVEFDIPAQATADGALTLTWRQQPGRGGNGRGCQVGEVWLIPAGPAPEH